jgi:Phosphate-selective porin O and P
MRKLVYSAVALTLVSVPGFASENEWSSLDQEINNLSSSLSAQNAPGPKIGGFIRTSYRYSTSTDALFGGPPNNEDESGFKLDKVRIEIKGDAGQDYSYVVSFELSGGGTAAPDFQTAVLRDAYVSWKVADNVKGTFGQFTKPVLHSSLVSDKNLLFTERTALGGFFRPRDDGVMFSGNFETIEWSLAAQNGLDGKEKKFNYAARLAANLMGAGVGKVEGAYGAGNETNLNVGVAWSEDKAISANGGKGDAWGGDLTLTSGPFSIAAEAVHFGKGDVSGGTFPNKDGGEMHWGSSNSFVSIDPADNTCWDATLSYMFTEMYEAAVRYEAGNANTPAGGTDPSVQAVSACINRYVQGHDIKWTLQWLKTKSDDNTNEIQEWTLGLTVGI